MFNFDEKLRTYRVQVGIGSIEDSFLRFRNRAHRYAQTVRRRRFIFRTFSISEHVRDETLVRKFRKRSLCTIVSRAVFDPRQRISSSFQSLEKSWFIIRHEAKISKSIETVLLFTNRQVCARTTTGSRRKPSNAVCIDAGNSIRILS